MTLNATLSLRLDASASINGLHVSVGTALSEMDAISMPDLKGDFIRVQEYAGNSDFSSIVSTLQQALAELTPVLANLPAANDTLASINQVVGLADRLGTLDLPNSIPELAAVIDGQLSYQGDFLGKLSRLTELLAGNATVQDARELLLSFVSLTGGKLDADDLKLPELVPAVLALAQSLGGLMSLHTLLEAGQQLAVVVNSQLDADHIAAGVEQVEKQLGLNTSLPLTDFLRNLDINDPSQIQAAKQAIENAIVPVRALVTAVAEGMAFGEATLVHLDADGLKHAVQETTLQLGSLNMTPLESGIQKLAKRIEPLFAIDLGAAPAMSLDGWLNQLESRLATLTAGIGSFDAANLSRPITEGINAIMALPSELARALLQLRLTIQQALASIHAAVRAIPMDVVADATRQVLAPIAEALSFIGELVGRLQTILDTTVSTLQTALETTEDAVDEVTEALQTLFQDAKNYIDQLNLQDVIGGVAEEIETFAQKLAQADMSPYFGTVVEAINTTTNVVDKVPFELLPDSMEQEVVNVVRPVKQTSVANLQREIEALLQIGPDGKFQLRPELESSLQGIQGKYDELLQTIRQHDPHTLLTSINAELDKLQTRIETLTPTVALEPVQQAINDIKRVVGGFDLNAELQPLRTGFDQVLEKVDEFQPSALLQETEAQLKQARDSVFGSLELDSWAETLTKLREQALALIDPLDPAQIQPQLEALLADLQSQAANLPRLELSFALGSLISALLGGGRQPRADSFVVVLDWLQGASAIQALATLARDAATLIDTARHGVETVDPQAIVMRLQPALRAVREAVAQLPDSAAKTELSACAKALDIETALAGFSVQRQRYLASLRQASNCFNELTHTGLSEVDIVTGRLRLVFSPLDFARHFIRDLLAVLGITGLESGLHDVVQRVFAVATPARLGGILQPIFTALKGRVQDLLDSFLNPIINAIGDLKALKEQFSLVAFMQELDAIHATARGQIGQLYPDQLLGETVAAFTNTQAQVLAFDPMEPLNNALEALRTNNAHVLSKLDGEAILATIRINFNPRKRSPSLVGY
ncbi:hypothetical protein SAMN05660964_01238 [Thiothrix caldifontis]|uniref:Uncharacterized protein n=1 Tax=Thiothrix caldifontis TaxID=525918 RepID=A0A1H3ZMV9_9GAMM|nr:hypothetical protein [Thiothrix caldifontis]SEA25030.1 hypothetical protein SAMN05660964_01238 [Thiothrix caldifontis]